MHTHSLRSVFPFPMHYYSRPAEHSLPMADQKAAVATASSAGAAFRHAREAARDKRAQTAAAEEARSLQSYMRERLTEQMTLKDPTAAAASIMTIKTVNTVPFKDQKAGTSGLRKKVCVLAVQCSAVQCNAVQCFVVTMEAEGNER
jgi:hypothetical protein